MTDKRQDKTDRRKNYVLCYTNYTIIQLYK